MRKTGEFGIKLAVLGTELAILGIELAILRIEIGIGARYFLVSGPGHQNLEGWHLKNQKSQM